MSDETNPSRIGDSPDELMLFGDAATRRVFIKQVAGTGAALALLKEGHAGSDGEIREWMSGNICRCGAYPNILAAIREAKSKTANAV